MNWQIVVVAWCQFVLASAALLLIARLMLARIAQPVERLRMITLAITGAFAVPLLMAVSPFAPWRLPLLQPEPTATVADHVPLREVTVSARPAETSAAMTPNSDSEVSHAFPPSVSVARSTHAPVDSGPLSQANPSNFDVWKLAALVILGIHATAAIFFLVQWALGVVRLRRLQSDTAPAPVAVQHLWGELTQRQGTRVQLLLSNKIETPLIFGWLRPTVVLPRHIAAGDQQRLRFCLAHEWSHIVQSDLATWRAVWFCQFLLWHQPLFWVLRRELRICQDVLADQRAVESSSDAIEYCQLLVDVAKSHQVASLQGALTLFDHPSQLRRRITMLLQPGLALRSRCSWAFSLIATPIAVALVLLTGFIRLELGYAEETAVEASQPSATEKKEESAKKEPAAASPRLEYDCLVVDKETSKGIPNASVVVRRSVLTAQENRILEESKHQTDAEGKYSFEIPPEQVAQSALYIELDVDHENYAARKGFGYALGMIRKNETLGERPFFERVELDAAEPITGTLLTPDGKPAADVRLLGYSKLKPDDFREYGSFTNATSDANGRFRLNLIKNGVGVYWILPQDFAIVQKAVGKTRGDLGEIRLQPGVRSGGRVLSADGKPVPGVAVNIDYRGPNQDLAGLQVGSSVERGAISDEQGRFSFDPLPPGDYHVNVGEHVSDPVRRDRTRYPIPGVFVAKKVTLKEGAEAQEIELQAVPHVVFNAQYYDSKGEKARGHEVFLYGELDGQWWFGQGRPDAQGTIALRVPHGLQKARVQLMTNEHGALRYRLGKGGELKSKQRDIDLGTLNDDIEDFEIVRYRAPVVLISAIGEDKQTIKDFKVTATYPWGEQQYVLEGELRSDISFEHQNDGRYRTSQLLPDEEVSFHVTAPGFEAATEKLKLAEGLEKELVVTLKKKESTPAKE